MAHLLIPHRFNGPRGSGNGGWTCGSVAAYLDPPAGTAVSVRLHAPPPLDVPLLVDHTAGSLVVTRDGSPVASASYPTSDPTPVEPVTVAEAAAAEQRYAGLRAHPFPTCFVCGPSRRPGDGLRIFAGPVSGREHTVAATWTPYETTLPITWAALDCPSGWSTDIEERPVVLGTMTALVHEMPTTRERYVVVAERRAVEGRKSHTASTIYGPDGRVLATATQIWFEIDPAAFN